jgi:hypothetical protein
LSGFDATFFLAAWSTHKTTSMRLLLIALLLGFAFTSCKKTNKYVLNGTYNYTGTSQRDGYPAICTGNYSVRGDKADFNDMCNWPQTFDPSFLFEGEYYIRIDGDSVLLTQGNGGDIGFYMNQYNLVKQ